jgi:heme A synthase
MENMERNVGGYDRIARLALMIPLFVVGVLGVMGATAVGSALGPIIGVAALAGAASLLFNVVTQKCLTNQLLGINTCEIEKEG